MDGDKRTQDEVFAQIGEEMKKLGDNTKAGYDELRKSVTSLRSELDKGLADAYTKEKADKLAADIIARQDALDKKSAENFGKIEEALASFKRNRGTAPSDSEEMKMLQDFTREVTGMKNGQNPGSISQEQMASYHKAFNEYLRTPGGDNQRSPDLVKALYVGSDPGGGVMVPTIMSNMIIKRLFESDPIRQLANTESITSGAVEFPVDWDEMSSGWEEETKTGNETATQNMKQKRITIYTQYARPRATQTFLEDAAVNVEAWLANKIGEKLARVEGAAFVTGTGIGMPRGFLTYDNGTTYGTIEQVNMGAANAITADGFKTIKFSMLEPYMERGTWLMNRLTVLATLKLKTGDGQYLWQPGMTQGAPSTIEGLPVRMAPSMPVIAANSLSVALADWREAYMIVDRLGITVQRDPYTVKPFVEFYTRKRLGGDVVNYQAIKIGKIAV